MVQHVSLCHRMCLDSAGSAGPDTEYTQAVAVGDANAVQLEVVVFALTATELGLQLQVSLGGENWSNKGTEQLLTGIGRALLTADTAITEAFIRYKCRIASGTGKAVFAATANLSSQ